MGGGKQGRHEGGEKWGEAAKRTGCSDEDSGRLFLEPGWGGSVETGDTSEGTWEGR